MIPVESGTFDAIGYDPAAKELHVYFARAGQTYVYEGVEQEVFRAFREADSKGSFFFAKIRDVYPSRKKS